MAATEKHDDLSEATAQSTTGLPGVVTPDQTRTDGPIEDPGLAHAETSGIIENRKRKDNLTGM